MRGNFDVLIFVALQNSAVPAVVFVSGEAEIGNADVEIKCTGGF